MRVRGPDHAFYWPDPSDALEAARPWANRSKRRALTVWAFLVLISGGAAAGWVFESVRVILVTGEPVAIPFFAVLALLAACALALWTDRMLFKASRPAFALPGEPYDERQSNLVAAASRPARMLDAFGVLAVAALGLAGATPGYVVGATVTVLALILSGPQIVLVWSLDPAEFDFDGEGGDDEADA